MIRDKKNTYWNQKRISFVTILLFMLLIVMILVSNMYLNSCIKTEENAENSRYELSMLGKQLADASDYLTDEVRKFAITGDLTNLYNYWYEVKVNKDRDAVISDIQQYNLPTEEQTLIEQAKGNSDMLIDTETKSMKMILASLLMEKGYLNGGNPEDSSNNDKNTANDSKDINQYTAKEIIEVLDFDCEKKDISQNYLEKFITIVLQYEYELPELSEEELRNQAISILYDKNYTDYKTRIMTPISSFQEQINERLNAEVDIATTGRKGASRLQIAVLIIAAMMIVAWIFIFGRLYVNPLKAYTQSIKKISKDGKETDFTKVRVSPAGAYELRNFGEKFNELSDVFNDTYTENVNSRNKMKKAMEEAREANNAKSDFLAQMSHELRTPLNAIAGYVELLTGTELDERQRKYCESIELSSDNLLGLISNILDISKIESGNMIFERRRFSLKKLLDEEYQVFLATAQKKKLKYELKIEEPIIDMIYGDEMKLRQVLTNLIGNAFKFTKNGGVTVTAAMVGETDRHATIEFEVIDSGIGIRPEDQEKIFDIFVQSDAGVTRKYGGSGLGLSISQKIVEEASGGRYKLEVDSKLMKGSRFHFKIRFRKCDEKYGETDSEAEKAFHGKGQRILIVDDNEINLVMEKELLEGYGLIADTAASGRQAIESVENNAYSLVFMDIRMPDMDGYEAVTEIRKLRKNVPVIALTADVVADVEEKVLAAGMNGYITKPLRKKELFRVLGRFISVQNVVTKDKSNKKEIFAEDKCLDILGGNEEILIELIHRFLKKQPEKIEKMVQYVKDTNYIAAREVMHDFMGIAGSLYLEQVYERGKMLQDSLRAEKSEGLDEFLTCYKETVESLKTYVKGSE